MEAADKEQGLPAVRGPYEFLRCRKQTETRKWATKMESAVKSGFSLPFKMFFRAIKPNEQLFCRFDVTQRKALC